MEPQNKSNISFRYHRWQRTKQPQTTSSKPYVLLNRILMVGISQTIMLTDLLGERRSDLRSTLGWQWSKGAGTGARAVLSERLRRWTWQQSKTRAPWRQCPAPMVRWGDRSLAIIIINVINQKYIVSVELWAHHLHILCYMTSLLLHQNGLVS